MVPHCVDHRHSRLLCEVCCNSGFPSSRCKDNQPLPGVQPVVLQLSRRFELCERLACTVAHARLECFTWQLRDGADRTDQHA